ncbi:MAG: polysaccharide lyase family protein [Candidatus Hydrogenedentes bacterium]|nr:polysaccharide lyase family protein [Candidatus Hydrogenedentota bacterium]
MTVNFSPKVGYFIGLFSIIVSINVCFAQKNNLEGEKYPLSLLWNIGEIDGKCVEFRLAPTEYEEYDEDPIYIVNYSKPSEDWIYIHPGPKNEWAKSIPHTFTVLFYIERVSPVGEGKLILSILETSKKYAPFATVYINGMAYPLRLPPGGGEEELLAVYDGVSPSPRKIEVNFPASILKVGENVIQVVISSGGWLIYDGIEFWAPEGVTLAEIEKSILRIGEPKPLPIVVEEDNKEFRTILVPVRCYGEPIEGKLSITENEPLDVSLNPGWNKILYKVKEVSQDKFASIEIKRDEKVVATRDFVLSPAKQITIHLVPHSHNDIGYTHIQSEVEEIQHKNIKKALEIIRGTKDYPEGARFCWSAEVLWAIKSFLNKADEESKRALIESVRESRFELPALFANQLTGLCSGEELIHLLDEAVRLSKELGINIDTALITDVPGYTWGLVPVLAQLGIKYLYCAPNLEWRVGDIREVWGDKPFYWVSQCGNYRILTYIGFAGYSWFFGGLDHFNDRMVDYLSALVERGYPFDIAISRYCILSDNGPPDEKLSDFVVEWNEKHKTPKIVITTAGKALRAFEEKYGSELPIFAGEITPYWEDGSASSARETALNRDTVQKLMMAETLWSLWLPNKYPSEKLAEAWENVILYDEHTWGAHNSISEPDSPFVNSQWEIKQSFAVKASNIAEELLQSFIDCISDKPKTVSKVAIFNPQPFSACAVVTLPAEWKLKGEKVIKDRVPIPSQRLKSGELIFLAKDVPGWGYAIFDLEEGNPSIPDKPVTVSEDFIIENEFLKVKINPSKGTIDSLVLKSTGREFINNEAEYKTNEYLYTKGRSPDKIVKPQDYAISIGESGPLLASVVITSEKVPGAKKIVNQVSLISGQDIVYIKNLIDKENIREPEAVHYSFAFDIPAPKIIYQTPFALVHLPEHQLPGSCKNYFTVQRWICISGENGGIALFTPDAPMIEIGKITVDPVVVGWKKSILQEANIFSYVMNNYWETNYKASQDGLHEFRYFIYPYAQLNLKDLETKSGLLCREFLAVPLGEGDISTMKKKEIKITPDWVVYHLKYSPEYSAYLLRLFNPSYEEVKVKIDYPDKKEVLVNYISSSGEKKESKFSGLIKPFESISLLLR